MQWGIAGLRVASVTCGSVCAATLTSAYLPVLARVVMPRLSKWVHAAPWAYQVLMHAARLPL